MLAKNEANYKQLITDLNQTPEVKFLPWLHAITRTAGCKVEPIKSHIPIIEFWNPKQLVPHYHTLKDKIYIPERHLFFGDDLYRKVVLHELAHATGHKNRLHRLTLTSFVDMKQGKIKTDIYAREEFIAESASIILMRYLKWETTRSYLYSKLYLNYYKPRFNPIYIDRCYELGEQAASYLIATHNW